MRTMTTSSICPPPMRREPRSPSRMTNSNCHLPFFNVCPPSSSLLTSTHPLRGLCLQAWLDPWQPWNRAADPPHRHPHSHRRPLLPSATSPSAWSQSDGKIQPQSALDFRLRFTSARRAVACGAAGSCSWATAPVPATPARRRANSRSRSLFSLSRRRLNTSSSASNSRSSPVGLADTASSAPPPSSSALPVASSSLPSASPCGPSSSWTR
mmetsp:Transcript_27435/g.88167  ORF Transcript_27435/g.88167 Transcript_27435/m.88167 type:complete len:211 (+) Transcript_27435:262-894(+)